ncbi:MAG: adenosine-specific kinase, partial [Candidatus Binataceae bacterium]
MELSAIEIVKPADANVIIGQAHVIKTVEDLYEAVVAAVPAVKFGVAFCEASGPCLIRHTGTDDELEAAAVRAAKAIGAGHVFIIMLGNAFPINVLNQVKAVAEVCSVFCATAN